MVLLSLRFLPLSFLVWVAICKSDERDVVYERLIRKASFSSTAFSGSAVARPLEIELGEVDSGATVEAVIEIRNDSEREFRIKQISMSCSCMEAKSLGAMILPGEEVSLMVKLKAAQTSSSAQLSQSIQLYESEDSAIQLLLHYKLKGLVCFKDRSAVMDVKENAKAKFFRIPLLITAPAKIENVKAFASNDLAGIQMTPKLIDGNCFLECTMEFAKIPTLGLVGELSIEETKLGRRSSIPCLVNREEQFKVTPSILRFAKKDGEWMAHCLVQVRDNATKENSTSVDSTEIQAETVGMLDLQVTCDGNCVVRSEVERIGSGLYRVKLRMTLPLVNDDEGKDRPQKIVWNGQYGNVVVGGATPLRLLGTDRE